MRPETTAPQPLQRRGARRGHSTVAADDTTTAALALAERGYPVLPCRPSKAPYTAHGLHDATTDPDQIRTWWRQWPDALAAVPTGAASGLVVVDIDPEGAEWYADHADRLACGRVHRTRRGHHLIYRYPDDEIRNSAGRIARGVDVRGEGGYIVWWPAHGHETVGDLDDIGEVPGWLLGLLTQRQTAVAPTGGAIPEGQRNDYLSREAFRLRRQGASVEQIREVIAAVNVARCTPPLDDAEIEAIARGKERVEPATNGRTIDVRAGEMPRIVGDAVAALRDAETPIYDRGGALYRPLRIETHDTADGVTRAPGTITLRPVDAVWLRVRLAEVAGWRRWRERERDWRTVDPPGEIARIIAEMPDAADWPHLRAVVTHPVITAEGRIIAEPGYDPGSRLLIDIDGYWPIPEAPTREDAVAACGRLRELLRYYPWVSDVDRAVALSLLLTAIARPVLPSAPLHGVDAPEAGSGKSMLVDVAAILATGAPAAVMDYGDDPAEAAKRLDGMLLAGDSMIAIDNIERPLEGAGICQTLTQPTRRVRPLGGSAVVTVPCTAMVCATGCNLTLRGDIVRRAIVCRLDAGTERPELRGIDQDLLAETRARRRELVGDAITIMHAYALAGHPDAIGLGSYAAWSRMVRSALIWAGEADPVQAMERTRGADPSRQAIHAVLRGWYRAYGADPVTAAEAITRADTDTELRDALAMVATRGGRLDSLALGRWLRSHRDRRAGALVLRRHGARTASARWIVEADTVVDRDGGDSWDGTTLREASGSGNIGIGGATRPERSGTSPLSQPSPPDDWPTDYGVIEETT